MALYLPDLLKVELQLLPLALELELATFRLVMANSFVYNLYEKF